MDVGHVTQDVHFHSGGSRVAAVLYIPIAGAGPFPCVVLAHGFSGTMDWILPDFARVFADAGSAVLIFDYRHFGASEGMPRQLVDSRRQLDDIRAALAYARSHPAIDERRIALWGTSLGGSHVITIAAEDSRLAAVVANVPALDMYRGLRRRHRSATYRPGPAAIARAVGWLVCCAALDEVRGWLGLSPLYLPVYGPLGHAAFSDPELAQRFRYVEASAPTWRNRMTPRFLFHAPRYRDGTAERIRCPLMVTLAHDDAEVSSPFVKEKVAGAVHLTTIEYPVGHFDLYHGAARDQLAQDHCRFLSRILGLSPDPTDRDDHLDGQRPYPRSVVR
ncbi:alpha/beta hydrolase [Mycobacterium sp. NPDC003323]